MIRTNADLVRLRLANQHLAASSLGSPAEVVAWFGAVQAQEYPAARWALGLRGRGLTDQTVARAFDAGEILRTHAMRPTWHFVARADIRWLQMLTGPRVQQLNAYYARKNELDAKTIARSRAVIERSLAGGQQRTRTELAAALRKAGIRAEGRRLAYLMMSAELDQVICSGARRGKQFTYALLEERAPKATRLPRDEALGELTRRYFTSHGPATLRDYVWWSGLTMGDARRGVEIAGRALMQETFGELTHWSAAPTPAFTRSLGGGGTRRSASAYLLPIYDEYLIAYKDRGAVTDPASTGRSSATIDGYAHWLVVDGRFVGTWRREETAAGVEVGLTPHRLLTTAERKAVVAAADRYSAFLETPVIVRGLAGNGR
jgi:Winged helix DNA-binding domain